MIYSKTKLTVLTALIAIGLQSILWAGTIIGPDGEEHGLRLELSVSDVMVAIREMGPLRLVFFTGIAMVMIGTVWFAVRTFRVRKRFRNHKRSEGLQQKFEPYQN